ncbi:MAG: TonB-dependent receptor plug domain-containing protein, partial [Mucilaginibacter sp.]
MKKIGYLIALLALIAFVPVAYAQNDAALQNNVSKLKSFLNDKIIEKAYLHFDRPYYAAGDTMYFKAYVTLGEYHLPSAASGILHVDLINPQNTIIRTILLQLKNGLAWGDFALPDTLKDGNYRVRAFTRYMQNTPDYLFNKTIPIKSSNGGGMVNAVQSTNPDIQFFPEGGDLIASLISKVAFKAIGTNGLGIDAKGVIVDNNNTQVATFHSSHLGMGYFYLQPEAGKTYKAKVTFSNGAQSSVDLPAPVAKGIMLQVKDTLGKVSLNIVCNKAYLQENQNKDVGLAIYSGGKVRTVTTKLDNRVMGMDLADKEFPSGIMQITLFSQDGEPLSERLLFLKNADMLDIAVNSNKQTYKSRDRVELNINTKSNNTGTQSYLSAAVIDGGKVPYNDNDETTILSYLLLTSDLKGYVEQPNYYFTSNTPQTASDLDNLMLTQGYRRFTWKQLMSGDNKPFTYAPEKEIIVTGTEKQPDGTPIANQDLLLMAPSANITMDEKTDNAGRFAYNLPPFADGTSFTLQATGSAKSKNQATITVEKDQEPAVSASMEPVTGEQSIGNAAMNTGSASNGSPNGRQEISGDDLGNSSSLTAALRGQLQGLKFVSGAPYLQGNRYPMLIVIDGKVTGSYANLDKIKTSNIKNVEVLKGSDASAYGSSGSSGVLVINTRYGVSGTDLSSPEYKYEGQNVVKTKYNDQASKNYRSSNFGGAGHADQAVNHEAFENAPNMITGLNGVLRNVNFINGTPYLLGESLTVNYLGESNEPMYIVLDGTPISIDIFDGLNPHSIETVEVLRASNASIYGINGGAGVLVLTSKIQDNDSPQTVETSLGTLNFRPRGFYKAREFYAPKYNTSSASANRPDLRSTIYWAPNIVTDKDGAASLEFYNADGKGTYRVIIEGIDANGNLGRKLFTYK